MTDVNKAELRRLAEAAAHKDWYAGNAYDKQFILKYQIITDTPDGKYVLLDGNQNFPDDCVANVAFVGAASPSVVLSLLNSEAQAKCEAGHAIQQKNAAYAECKALRTELEACRKDAVRFQWLRDKCHLFQHYRAMKWRPDAFEREIDAAMSQEATNG